MKSQGRAVVGWCETKCSRREIEFRVKNHLLHPMECESPFDNIAARRRRPIIGRICKQYSRPAADRQVHLDEVRTLLALKETVNYLLDVEKEFSTDAQWTLVYEFVADRFRAVRQDIIIQQLKTNATVRIFEQMIIFYVKARHRCEQLKTPTYNAVLHFKELDECLQRWSQFEVKSEEIRVLHLLYSISNPDIFKQLRYQREDLEPETYALLWKLVSAHTTQNYVRFFRVLSELNNSLCSLTLMLTIKRIRLNAFEALAASNKSPACSIPVEVVCGWLALNDARLFEKCTKECFDKSPIVNQAFKCHGCKLTKVDALKLSFEWASFS